MRSTDFKKHKLKQNLTVYTHVKACKLTIFKIVKSRDVRCNLIFHGMVWLFCTEIRVGSFDSDQIPRSAASELVCAVCMCPLNGFPV